MKVFITGAESFIGAKLWEMCGELGHEVSGIDLAASAKPTVLKLDVRDPGIEKVIPSDSVVVHLAAVSTDSLCKSDPLEALDVNVGGTVNVVRAAKRAGCRQFIFASTEWVYGDCANDDVQVEEHPIAVMHMAAPYAFSKVVGEKIVTFAGLPNTTILRFGIVYGPRDRNWCAVENLFDKVKRGVDVELGSVSTSRKFIHVEDLCQGIVAGFGLEGVHTINLAGDNSVTLGDVIRVSEQVTNRRVNVKETAPNAPSIRNPANAKAKALLGWRPRISLEEGLRSLDAYMTRAASTVNA